MSCCQGHDNVGQTLRSSCLFSSSLLTFGRSFFPFLLTWPLSSLVTSCAWQVTSGRLQVRQRIDLSSDDKESVAEVGHAFESFPYVSLSVRHLTCSQLLVTRALSR